MSRYGIIVNVDRCAGCFACAVACKEENQVAPGIFWGKDQAQRKRPRQRHQLVPHELRTATIRPA